MVKFKNTIIIETKLLKKIECLTIKQKVLGRTVEDVINTLLENAVYMREQQAKSRRQLMSLGISVGDDVCIHCKECCLSWRISPYSDNPQYHCPNGCNSELRATDAQIEHIKDALA